MNVIVENKMTALTFIKIARAYVFLLVVLLLFHGAYAYSPYEDIQNHDGVLCTNCHKKYPELVKNPNVRSNFPCFKRPCHYSAPEWGGSRYQIHINSEVCKACHSNIFYDEYNVHTVHKNEVPCKVCHMSPRGWNSSIVIIPASNKSAVYEGESIFIPENSECSYCHLGLAGVSLRLHDIHKRTLTSNLSCIPCHGEDVTKREDLMAEFFNISTPKNIKKPEIIPIKEFSRWFDEIAKIFIAQVVKR